MLRLGKYLRPYAILIACAVILLFVQANCDLALPDYMSKIVNVGIQQGGVQDAAPSALRKLSMERLLLFVSDEEAKRLGEDYELVEPGTDAQKSLASRYPVSGDEPIYVRRRISKEALADANSIMARSWLVVSGIEKAVRDPGSAQAGGQAMGFDLSRLPPGTDPFALLRGLPEADRAKLRDSISLKFAAMGPSMVLQAATGTVKEEYRALGADVDRIQMDYIFAMGLLMLAIALVSGACTVSVGYLSARAAAGLARDLRLAVFQRVESFSSREFDTFSTASLITRTTNDVMQVQMVVIMMMRMVFYAPIIGIGGVIRAVQRDSSMWWIIALAIGIISILIAFVYKIAFPKFKSIQGLIDRLNLVSRESLSGMMVIRAFNKEKREEERFDGANKDLTKTMLFVNRLMVVMMPFMMLLMNGVMLLIIWIGSHQVAESSMQVGDMMAFMQYAMQIMFAFLMLSMMFIMLPRAAVAGDRIAEVLAADPSIEDPEAPEDFDAALAGRLEFRNVSFRYPGAEEDVLRDISFTALPGKTTAFIGATGSGKSTVVSLIPRFYDVTGGEVLVEGRDVRKVSQASLRKRIGYVPQKSSLFSGTIESNLRYADEHAEEGTLKDSISIAQADEFLASRPEGMGADISQGGSNVSGGQKQRLSIARALVKKPPIFIFDDSFSALDFKTDSRLRKALKAKTGGSTVLIVTQRVSTIMNADQIVVLEDGRIAGKGTHRELMETCETYREIASSQLSKEELA